MGGDLVRHRAVGKAMDRRLQSPVRHREETRPAGADVNEAAVVIPDAGDGESSAVPLTPQQRDTVLTLADAEAHLPGVGVRDVVGAGGCGVGRRSSQDAAVIGVEHEPLLVEFRLDVIGQRCT